MGKPSAPIVIVDISVTENQFPGWADAALQMCAVNLRGWFSFIELEANSSCHLVV